MQICAALVSINEDEEKIHLSKSFDTIDEIEINLAEEAMRIDEDGVYYYIYMRKGEIKLYEYWTVVGNASKYDGSWEVIAQYGVWACMYENHPPPFKKNPLVDQDMGKKSSLGKQFDLDLNSHFDLSRFEDADDYYGSFTRKKNKHNRVSGGINLDKNFSLFEDQRYCGKRNKKHKNLIELPLIDNKKKNKLKKCEASFDLIANILGNETKLFKDCPVVMWNDVDVNTRSNYDCD
jgi:hypothetical protein